MGREILTETDDLLRKIDLDVSNARNRAAVDRLFSGSGPTKESVLCVRECQCGKLERMHTGWIAGRWRDMGEGYDGWRVSRATVHYFNAHGDPDLTKNNVEVALWEQEQGIPQSENVARMMERYWRRVVGK